MTPQDLLNTQLIAEESHPWLCDFRKTQADKLTELLNFRAKLMSAGSTRLCALCLNSQYQPAASANISEDHLEQYRLEGSIELVFVNGYFNAELSRIPAELPKGYSVSAVSEALCR